MSRKLLILWMLMAAPLLQARTLMHCEMMGEVEMAADCCCDGHDVENTSAPQDDGCCEVVVAAQALPDGIKATAQDDEGFDAYQAQAPPDWTSTAVFAPRSQQYPALEPMQTASRSPLWLTTARLRL